MVDSGLQCTEQCIEVYNGLKLSKLYKFIIYKVENEVEIVVDSTGGPEESYEAFIAKLPPNEPRYGIIDFPLVIEENPPRTENKIVFVNWVPDNCPPRAKMIQSSSKESFKRRLEGVHKELQATDVSEVQESSIEETCRRR